MTTIREAALVLASLDQDHATEQNGVGFAGSTQFVHDLLVFPQWTAGQQERVKQALNLHKKQLLGLGIDYEVLEAEPVVTSEVAGAGIINFVALGAYVQGPAFTLSFKFSDSVREALKQSLPGRKWNPDTKVWEVPTASYEEVEQFASAWNFQFTEAARQVIDQSHMNPPKRKLTDPLTPREEQMMEHILDKFSANPKGVPKPGTVTVPAKNIIVSDNQFEIRFPYDDAVRMDLKESVPGRYWDGTRKVWTAPLTSEMEIREFAARNDFVLGKSVGEASQKQQDVTPKKLDSDFMKDFRSKSGFALRPYQRAGAEHLVKNERCYLADGVRLGKTIQCMAGIRHVSQKLGRPAKVLVVCPSSVTSVWQRHFAEWLPEVRYRTAPAGIEGASAYITSYQRAQKNRQRLKAEKWDIVILDEAHKCKNRNAARTQALLGHGDRRDDTFEPGIVDGVKYRWFLTATAVEKKPYELLQPLIGLGRLDDMGGFTGYATRYCGWVKGVQGSITGCVFSRLPELNQKLNSTGIWLRRQMEDVFAEMPEKTYEHVPIALSNPKRYFGEQAATFDRIDNADGEMGSAEVITQMTALRRIAAEEKVEGVIEWVSEFLDDSEQKLVLLGWHTEPLQRLFATFKDQAVILTGASTAQQRLKAMDDFQTKSEIRLFIGNILAAGEGIDLSAASDVALLELPYNSSTLDQGLGRVLKPGVTKRIGVWYLLAPGTIDEEIATLIDQKRRIAAGIHDGRVTTDDDKDMVSRLLKNLRSKVVA